jgi:hypothetical protein
MLTLLSCQNSTSTKGLNSADSSVIDSSKNYKANEPNSSDTTGFLSNCQNWTHGVFQGYLQGLDVEKDSLGTFCFYDCYDCKESFEIIFIHKTKKGPDTDNSIWKEFENSCKNSYANFNCFVFVYPMRDPDKQKDVHAMNIDFPVGVKVYERIAGDNWNFVRAVETKSFKELSLLKFRTIYHLN